MERIQQRLHKYMGYEPDDLARRLLDERPPLAALSALVALEDKLLKNPQSVRSPNCLLTTLLSAQNTRRELTKDRGAGAGPEGPREVLERCDQRERSVVAKLERQEVKKIQDDLSNAKGDANIGGGNLPVHIAGRIYTLVKEGTPLSQLKDVYRNRYKEEFEIKRWGFSKVTQLVASIPGLTVSKLPDGRNRMTVAADDAAFHAALRQSNAPPTGGLPPPRGGGNSPVTRHGTAPTLAAPPRQKPGVLSAGASATASAWTVRTLCDMGFAPEDARKALEKTGGNVDAAIELLTTQLDEPGPMLNGHTASPGGGAWGGAGAAARAAAGPKETSANAAAAAAAAQAKAAQAAAQAKADLLPQQQAALLLERMRRNGWGEGGVEELDEEGADTADEQGDANLANQDGTQPFQDGAQVVVVEKKFDGMDDSQLSLAVGDQVELVSRDPSGWTYGRLIGGDREGAEGWFPHYVGRAARMKPKPQFPPPPLESPPENETKRKNTMASVTTTFSATEENQLSLKKGDSVEIVDKNPNGWTYCRIPATGAEGWFPHNFLKVED